MGSFERGEKVIISAVGLQNGNDLEKLGGEMRGREGEETQLSLCGGSEKWKEEEGKAL